MEDTSYAQQPAQSPSEEAALKRHLPFCLASSYDCKDLNRLSHVSQVPTASQTLTRVAVQTREHTFIQRPEVTGGCSWGSSMLLFETKPLTDEAGLED